MIVRSLAAALVLTLAHQAAAQTAQDAPAQDPDAPIRVEEQVVVSASRAEQELVNAPAAVSVITTETIRSSPALHVGDLIRAVPGVNVTQVSARDVNLTTRGATSTLATSQLALVDGRSIYLDFFGMVMWDLVPTNPDEIRQIEVIRGPASAVWGANAMTGVVNVLTRTPREMAAAGGTSVTIGAGTFNRSVTGRDQDSGSLFYVNGTHAEAPNDRWAFKIGAGYFTQEPMPRPTGTIPNAFNTPYPPYTNLGTSQPKFDARADYDFAGGATLTFAGGVAGTEGIIHGGIGPFDISDDSRMGYVTTRYQDGGRRVAFFTNLLDGNAANLLARGPTGEPLPLVFDTRTFDLEASDTRTLGTMHILTFGGNYRHNTFDISLAPAGEDRNEGGIFVQDEVFLSPMFRWVIGGRVDTFSSIDGAVFSPRTSLLVKPAPAHTFRISYNRAFRAPSLVNNHIQATILNEVNLSALSPALSSFVFPITAAGNPELEEEKLTAYEIGYAGVIAGRATATVAVYWNTTRDGIYFTPVAAYTPAAPPPGWPLPPAVLGVLAALPTPVVLPSHFTYLNIGTIRDRGVELGIDAVVTPSVSVFTNYSFQAMPEIEDFRPGTGIRDINWPSKHRVNAGFNAGDDRFLGNLLVSYTSEAYWQDVLDARYAGTTDAYTLVNGAFGVRWLDNRLVTSVKVNNLANQEVQQHIFGDVMKRQVIGEARFTF